MVEKTWSLDIVNATNELASEIRQIRQITYFTEPT